MAGNNQPEGDMPEWLPEMLGEAGREGFYEKLDRHAAVFVARSQRQLVVSFDHLSGAGHPGYDAVPWEFENIRNNGWSHLGLFAPGATWYRDEAVIGFFAELRDNGFFEQFDRVAFLGTSMGGFAALAFADFAPGATIVALSPQTTLHPRLVPWDQRYPLGQAQNWHLPCSDAAQSLDRIERAYVLYDPWQPGDRLHFERLTSDRIVPLKGFWFGHKTGAFLRRMGYLQQFLTDTISGELTQDGFYREIRARKNLLMYRRAAEAYMEANDRAAWVPRFRKAFQTRKRQLKAKQA